MIGITIDDLNRLIECGTPIVQNMKDSDETKHKQSKK